MGNMCKGLGLCGCLVFFGCSGSGDVANTECDSSLPTITLGAVVGMSGVIDLGRLWNSTMQMAADAVNEAGGIRKHCLMLHALDSQSIKTVGLEKVKTLLDDSSVKAIITSESDVTACVLLSEYLRLDLDPACPATTTARTDLSPLLCHSCTAPDFDGLPMPKVEGATMLWRFMESNIRQGRVLADIAIADGQRSAATYAINVPFGTALVAAFKNQFVAAGGTVEDRWQKTFGATRTATEIRDDLAAIFADYGTTSQPEVFIPNSVPAIITPIADAWAAAGAPGRILAPFSVSSKDAWAASVLTNAQRSRVSGVAYSIAGGYHGDAFAQATREAFGEEPIQLSASAYDAVMAFALAAVASGVETPTRTDIHKAMQLLSAADGTVIGSDEFARGAEILESGGKINYQGASGDLDWDMEQNNVVTTPLSRWALGPDGALDFTAMQ